MKNKIYLYEYFVCLCIPYYKKNVWYVHESVKILLLQLHINCTNLTRDLSLEVNQKMLIHCMLGTRP